MMNPKLTYRGNQYISLTTQIRAKVSKLAMPHKYRLSPEKDSNKVILIRPIQYYTYRGVSYTKNLVFDTKTQLLLDIDRQ